jgi:hypothetical protein
VHTAVKIHMCLSKDSRIGTSFRCPDKKQPFSGLFKEKVKFASWNIGSLTGRAGEVVEVLERRGISLCCLQETRWKETGTDWVQGKESKYKLFWVSSEEGQGGVGIIIKESWEDKVIEVRKISSRLILLKMILNERVISIISAYAPQVGREAVAKDDFWDTLSAICMDISDKEMIIVGGDLNGHVGEGIQGYEGIHGGYGYGCRNEEGVRILDFTVALELAKRN